MTAEIVAINSDVTRQKELLESFRAAACLLDHEVIEEILAADEWHRYDLLTDLATEMAEKVICPSSDLLSRFKGAAIETLVTMMPTMADIPRAAREARSRAEYSSPASIQRLTRSTNAPSPSTRAGGTRGHRHQLRLPVFPT